MRNRVAGAVAIALTVACMAWALCGCTGAYEPADRTPEVDSSALAVDGTLRVGVDASSYPFAGQNRNGVISGIDVDVAAALADEMGLKVELVDIGMEGASALQDGKVDVVMGVEPDEAPEGTCWIGDAYLPSRIVLFSMDEDAQAPSEDSPVIGAQTSSLSAWLVSEQYGAGALKASDDLKAVFQDLERGAVAYAAADSAVGSYLANSLGIDARIVATMQDSDGYRIAVAASNVPLQLAVTQALSTVQGNGVMDVVCARWFGGPIDLSHARPVGPAVPSDAETQGREASDAADEGQEEAQAAGEGNPDEGAAPAASDGQEAAPGATPVAGANAVVPQ